MLLACSRGLTKVVELLLEHEAHIHETLLQQINAGMRSIDLPNKDNYFVEITKLVIPALLLKYPTLPKPSCILENSELSLFWDKQSKKINSFLQNESLCGKEHRKKILNKIILNKNITLLSLAFKFFEPANIANNDAKSEKNVATVAQVFR